MRWNGLDTELNHEGTEENAEPDTKSIHAAEQHLKSSGRNLRVKQREEKVHTIGGADILHITEKGGRRHRTENGPDSLSKSQGKRTREPDISRDRESHKDNDEVHTSYDELANNDMDDAALQKRFAVREKQQHIKTYSRPHSHSRATKHGKTNMRSLTRKAKDIAAVSYQYGRNTDGQGRGMKGVKSALAKLEEKEAATQQAQSLEAIEARIRVSDSHAKEKAREEERSSANGRLRAFKTPEEGEASPGAAEKRLKTESRRCMDGEEHAKLASSTLHASKKQKKKEHKKKDKKEREDAGRKASVSNMFRKGREIKGQSDSGEDAEASAGGGMLNVLTGQMKNAARTVASSLLKKLLLGLLSFVIHIMATAVMLIIVCVCVVIGMIMAVLGPILVVIICVASIFSFLFTSETEEAVDTTSEKYIDNYISALLIEYRDMIADDYANESSLIGGDYLEYDLCYEIMGEDGKYLSGQVSYDKDEDITSKENDAKRTKASNKLLNDALGKGGTYRQEFMDSIKMVYFAKMYNEDDVSLDDESEDDQTSPYLMINTGTEKDMLEEIFWEFCAVSETDKKVAWKSGNKPYPFRMTDEYSNKRKNMKYTKARYVEVHVLTMNEYLSKHPLSEKELKYYNEFAEIKKPEQ